MHRSLLTRLASGVLLSFTIVWLAPGAALGQAKADDKKPRDKSDKKVKFDTVDGVELQGYFYPKDSRAPAVILLHNIGGNIQQAGWDKLADELNKKFAVLSFDFRGHGNSTSVSPTFWSYPATALSNRSLKGYSPSKPKERISYQDFPASYYPRLVDDIAAARMFLDKKNDAGQCNSASIIVVGAEQGAVLGALWMQSEFSRYRVTGDAFTRKADSTSEGKNILAAVWISMAHALKNQQMPVREWLKTSGHDNKVPMYFVYGGKDSAGETFAKNTSEYLKSGNVKLELTGHKSIPDTRLTGADLLGGKGLDTAELIAQYLDKVVKDKGAADADKRDSEKAVYVWKFGIAQIPAKLAGDKLLLPVPYQRFLR